MNNQIKYAIYIETLKIINNNMNNIYFSLKQIKIKIKMIIKFKMKINNKKTNNQQNLIIKFSNNFKMTSKGIHKEVIVFKQRRKE